MHIVLVVNLSTTSRFGVTPHFKWGYHILCKQNVVFLGNYPTSGDEGFDFVAVGTAFDKDMCPPKGVDSRFWKFRQLTQTNANERLGSPEHVLGTQINAVLTLGVLAKFVET